MLGVGWKARLLDVAYVAAVVLMVVGMTVGALFLATGAW